MKTKKPTPGIDPEIFVEAAEQLFAETERGWRSRGCCWAIGRAVDERGLPHGAMGIPNGPERDRSYLRTIEFLDACFRPEDYSSQPGKYSAWWYETPVDGVEDTHDLRREARLFGLLLLAELARDGFVPPGYPLDLDLDLDLT